MQYKTGNVVHNEVDKLSTNLVTRLDSVNDAITAYPVGGTHTRVTTDGQATQGTGVLRRVTITQTASTTPTAGVLTIYDSASETGTVIFSTYIKNVDITSPMQWTLDRAVTTGVYVGFDATLAGVTVSVDFIPTQA